MTSDNIRVRNTTKALPLEVKNRCFRVTLPIDGLLWLNSKVSDKGQEALRVVGRLPTLRLPMHRMLNLGQASNKP